MKRHWLQSYQIAGTVRANAAKEAVTEAAEQDCYNRETARLSKYNEIVSMYWENGLTFMALGFDPAQHHGNRTEQLCHGKLA